jgi:histidinol-phosphate aminotransferase
VNKTHLELAVAGVRGLKPYQPGKPVSELEREHGVSGIVTLATNGNPLGPGDAVRQAMADAVEDIGRYPDGSGFHLKEAIAERHDLPPDRVTLGNGSNDVLVLLAEAFLEPGLEAVYSRYAFAVYAIAVQAAGATARIAPALDWDSPMPLGHDLDKMAEAIGPQTRLVFVANPNNPTGTWIDGDRLKSFLDSLPRETLVVVDEAYAEYVEEPGYPDCSAWLREHPNLVVTRTFSKAFGLAGLRIGYALSAPGVADILNRIRQPFNVNSVAQAAGVAALEDRSYLARSVEINNAERHRVAAAFDSLGLRHVPSVGNFILVDFERPAAPIYKALLRRAVIVRPVANYGLPTCLRISIGTPDENTKLISALTEVLADAPD